MKRESIFNKWCWHNWISSTLEHIGTEDHFLNIILVAQTLRETINKWDLLKLKSFYKAKDMVNKTKQQLTEWEVTDSVDNVHSKAYNDSYSLWIIYVHCCSHGNMLLFIS